MLTTGKLAAESVVSSRRALECVIGMEYCGTDRTGKRLMGMIENRGLSNLCLKDELLVWEVPNKWSFEDAATIPVVYATCYYALYQKG